MSDRRRRNEGPLYIYVQNGSTTAPLAAAAAAAAGSTADPGTQLPHHIKSSSMQQRLHTQGEPWACSVYGALLDGVDMYVIEMPARSGAVHKQMNQFGVPCCVKEIPAVSPATILDGKNLTTVQLAEECDRRVEQADGKQDPRFGPFQVSKTAFATLLSHITAFKAACDDPNHKDVLVILEDDTQLEPMHFWPMSLVEMLKKLPPTWRIVNAACSNHNDPFTPDLFRYNNIADDYGTGAVIINLKDPKVCGMIENKTPVQFVLGIDVKEMCQPADIFMYVHLSDIHVGEKGFQPWTTNLPLFYFSPSNPMEEVQFLNHGPDYGSLKQAWARAQRAAWAVYWAGSKMGEDDCRVGHAAAAVASGSFPATQRAA